MRIIDRKNIPILMFHSVGNENSKWSRKFLSVSLKQFEHFCIFLKQKNYKTIILPEWYGLQDNSCNKNQKYICLTFDDGYLDNWIYVYPTLKKYNLCGTVFINPEFVDHTSEFRPNLESVNFENNKLSESNTLGFLSWDEIKKMDREGVLDAQSHSMSHNFYFQSNKLLDIYEGQDKYDWLPWFLYTARKPFYMTENQRNLLKCGYPIFEYGRSLGLRRYFPDAEFIDFGISLYKKGIDKSDILEKLKSKLYLLPGSYESDKEMEERYHFELFESKRILENKLNKQVDFLCWPGGGYNELSIEISKQAGYKASTVASRDKKLKFDNTGIYKRIIRIGMGSTITSSKAVKHYIPYYKHLVNIFKGRTSNRFPFNYGRIIKLYYEIKDSFYK